MNSPILDFMRFMRFFGYGKVAKTLMKLNQTKDKLLQTLIDKCRSIGTDDDPAAKAGHQAQGRKGSMIQVLMELQATEPESFPDEIVKGLANPKRILARNNCQAALYYFLFSPCLLVLVL